MNFNEHMFKILTKFVINKKTNRPHQHLINRTMSHFDERAATWDSKPSNWERSEAIAKALKQATTINPQHCALEYGAGTGILSFLLKDDFAEITLMDNSVEMVKVMQQKISDGKVNHLKPLFFNLETTDYNHGLFDVIFTQMVMHHVSDVNQLLNKFYQLLNHGGHLAIADLYAEDGSFHGDGFEGHLGFDINELTERMTQCGFKSIKHKTCFSINKTNEANETKTYPLFLLTAQK